MLRHKRHCWEDYERTSESSKYRPFLKVENQCTVIIEDRLQYQIKMISKFVSNLKSMIYQMDI